MRARVLLACVAVLFACRRDDRDQRRAPVPPPAPPTPPGPVTRAPDIELLHAVPAIIAVSSVVANPTLQPHAIADGDLATAWNSRTNDLTGAWVRIRVPPAARLHAVRLTAGFSAVGPEGNYFTLNHRIRRVRITRVGTNELLADRELDITERELQTIPIATTGGDIQIEIVEMVPGTKTRWREAAISELEVIGALPGAIERTRSPVIKVGSLDGDAIAPTRSVQVEPVAPLVAIDPAWEEPAYDEYSGAPPPGWRVSPYGTATECRTVVSVGGHSYDLGATPGECRRLECEPGSGGREVATAGRWTLISTPVVRPVEGEMAGILPDHVELLEQVCTLHDRTLACSKPLLVLRGDCDRYTQLPDTLLEGTRLVPTIVGDNLRLRVDEDHTSRDPAVTKAAGNYLIVGPP